MKKRVFGRRFKRDVNERKALFRSLIREVILNGSIQTTEAKAKSVKSQLEKLVTKAKMQGKNASGLLRQDLSPEIANRLITEIAPKFADRNGGFVRIFRTKRRVKDGAQMVMMEFVLDSEEAPKAAAEPVSKPKRGEKKNNTAKKETEEKPKRGRRVTREKSNTNNKK